jgi:hypothetical protein
MTIVATHAALGWYESCAKENNAQKLHLFCSAKAVQQRRNL